MDIQVVNNLIMKEIAIKMTMRHSSLVRRENINSCYIDEHMGKQSLSCAAGGGRYKLVQLLSEDNLTLAIEISNVHISWLRTSPSKYISFKNIHPYTQIYTDSSDLQ